MLLLVVFYVLSCFSVKCFIVLQSMSQRRQSLQRILRTRRPTATTAKQRIRSVRRKKNGGASSPPAIAIDSFVEDSQGSVSEYSARKPLHRRAPIVSENAKCSDMPRTAVEAVGIGRDVEEDQYNLLESTEELELPCGAGSDDEMREHRELDGDLTVVGEVSHVVSDAHNDDDAAVCERSTLIPSEPVATAHPSMQTPPSPPPSDSDVNQAVSGERPAASSRQQRLSSLPTLQLDGQLDTPASTVRNQSSVVDKVDTSAPCHYFSFQTANDYSIVSYSVPLVLSSCVALYLTVF